MTSPGQPSSPIYGTFRVATRVDEHTGEELEDQEHVELRIDMPPDTIVGRFPNVTTYALPGQRPYLSRDGRHPYLAEPKDQVR